MNDMRPPSANPSSHRQYINDNREIELVRGPQGDPGPSGPPGPEGPEGPAGVAETRSIVYPAGLAVGGRQQFFNDYSTPFAAKNQDGSWMILLLTEGVWQISAGIVLGAPDPSSAWASIGVRIGGPPPPTWNGMAWDDFPPENLVGVDSEFWSPGFGGVWASLLMTAPWTVPPGRTDAVLIVAGTDFGGPITARQEFEADQYIRAVRVGGEPLPGPPGETRLVEVREDVTNSGIGADQFFSPDGDFVKNQDDSWMYVLLDEGVWDVTAGAQISAPEGAQIWGMIGTRPAGAPPPGWTGWDGILPIAVATDVRFWPVGFGGVEQFLLFNSPYVVPAGEEHALLVAFGSDTGHQAKSRRFNQYIKATRIGSA